MDEVNGKGRKKKNKRKPDDIFELNDKNFVHVAHLDLILIVDPQLILKFIKKIAILFYDILNIGYQFTIWKSIADSVTIKKGVKQIKKIIQFEKNMIQNILKKKDLIYLYI